MRIADLFIVGLCLVWTLALGWTVAPDHDIWKLLTAPATAAWVQAIGSVAAIAAIFVSQQRDHTHGQKSELETKRHASTAEVDALDYLLAEARVVVEACRNRSHNENWTAATAKYSASQLDASMALLTQIDFKLLPNQDCISVFFRARQALIASRRYVDLTAEGLPEQPSETLFDGPHNVLKGLSAKLKDH